MGIPKQKVGPFETELSFIFIEDMDVSARVTCLTHIQQRLVHLALRVPYLPTAA